MNDKQINQPENNQGEIVIYQSKTGDTKIDVRFVDETVWLTQAQLCELYQTSKSNISEHIKHIFEEGELDEVSVVRKFRTTAADGKSYNVTHYKARREYQKYQVQNLSPVEEAYLETIKGVEKTARKKAKDKEDKK